MEARVVGSTSARRALNPRILGMVGRSLVEQGESLHFLDIDRMGVVELIPAQQSWEVYGGFRPETWVIDATLQGADTVRQEVAHCAAAGCTSSGRRLPSGRTAAYPPYRGGRRSRFELGEDGRGCADGARRRMPAKVVYPYFRAIGQAANQITWRSNLRAAISTGGWKRRMFPETTHVRIGRQRPQTDWKAQRVTPMPDPALVQLGYAKCPSAASSPRSGAHPSVARRTAGRQARPTAKRGSS